VMTIREYNFSDVGVETSTQPSAGTPTADDDLVTKEYVDDSISTHASDTSTHGVGEVVGRTEAQTLTNKTISASSNTISNLAVTNLAAGVLDTDISSVSGSDDTIPSAKAVKTYVDAQVGAAGLDSPLTIDNYTIAASVAASALTIALKNKAGSDPDSSSPVLVAFRSETASSGSYSTVSVEAATSIVVPSGATLGHTSAKTEQIYVYLLNNAGTVELLVSSTPLNESITHTTTAIDTSSDSLTGKYSTSARTSKAIRYLGRLEITSATAGTWATAPAVIDLGRQVKSASTLPDSEATRLGLKTYRHGGSYNNSLAPTITMPARSPSGGGAAITVNRSSFIPFEDQDGNWFLDFRFNVSVPSVAATTSITFSVAGITSEASADQAFTSWANNVTGNDRALVTNNSSSFVHTHSGSTTTNYSCSGIIELNAKPTWAY